MCYIHVYYIYIYLKLKKLSLFTDNRDAYIFHFEINISIHHCYIRDQSLHLNLPLHPSIHTSIHISTFLSLQPIHLSSFPTKSLPPSHLHYSLYPVSPPLPTLLLLYPTLPLLLQQPGLGLSLHISLHHSYALPFPRPSSSLPLTSPPFPSTDESMHQVPAKRVQQDQMSELLQAEAFALRPCPRVLPYRPLYHTLWVYVRSTRTVRLL